MRRGCYILIKSLLWLFNLDWFKIWILIKVWKSKAICQIYLILWFGLLIEELLIWFSHTYNICIFKLKLIYLRFFVLIATITSHSLFKITFIYLFQVTRNLMNNLFSLFKKVLLCISSCWRHKFLRVNKIVLRRFYMIFNNNRVGHHNWTNHF